MFSSKTEVDFSTRLHKIAYSETGFFGKMIVDYLDEKEALNSFYGRYPQPEAFSDQIAEKRKSYQNRRLLCDALENQYRKAKLKSTSLNMLREPNAFTVTTGHQVCLFGGPSYFLYKIVSAIKTCEALTANHPEFSFVPVFWMATEDHDFAEANHFNFRDEKIEWESGQGGAVGRMKLDGMPELWDELESKFGVGYNASQLRDLFKKAYLQSENVADATRRLVHELFGKYGVVVVDGDDPQLKALAKDAFKKEILEQPSEALIQSTTHKLESKGYGGQIHPRPINLFYLGEQLRERIIPHADGAFEVAHTDLKFSHEEILNLLDQSPERFSPNVALRGLYQEIILPNLAYIGGGGELAYWFQLKGVFEAYNIPFPILMLRNSAAIINPKTGSLMEKLKLSIPDLFQDAFELEKRLISEESEEDLSLEEEKERAEDLFLHIEARLRKLDPSLERTVGSAFTRTRRLLDQLEKKMLRAEKKKQEVLINRLTEIRAYLFPKDGLQERTANFSNFYLELGPAFVDALVESFDPFNNQFTLIEFRQAE
jgi:bacillithiol biosynthesis cysteine-adding enzyme BshC